MKRLLLLPLLAITALGAFPLTVAAASPPAQAQYVCLIVLDAGRPDYITKFLGSMPNLRSIMPQARTYDRAWVGDLMSITPPGHAVIGTGSFPKDDGGLVNWDWGIHSTGKISPTTQALVNFQNGYVFQIMKNSGTPSLSQEVRRKYPTGLAVAGSGAHFHAAGPMGGPYASWIFSYQRASGYWAPFTLGQNPVPSALLNDSSLRTRLVSSNNSSVPLLYDPLSIGVQDSLVMKFGARTVERYKPRALMLNLPEVDTIGHWSQQWYHDESILYKAFDKDLGKLINAYKTAGIYNQTLFVVTADHGMMQSTNRVLNRLAVRAILKTNNIPDILVNGGGTGGPTMMSIWLKQMSQNRRAAQLVWNRHLDNVSAIFYQVHDANGYHYDLMGCESCSPALVKTYHYMLGTEAGPTGEDLAILLREGARNSGLPQMLGRHGGADWASQHITLMMWGPGVAPGTSQHPAKLADISPTIERFMGITPRARDGIVLADAFQNPVASDVAKQAKSDVMQNVYVTALSQRAQHDLYLEAHGLMPNFVPADENIFHWKKALAYTAAGVVVLIVTAIGLGWAIIEVRRQGTGLNWVA